jgi:hypothetical protein
MSDYTTAFGSIESYARGRVEPIADDVRAYAFSNVFETCARARPYERVVFGINQIYVLEAIRAEGTSPWYTCAHDEFLLCMDKEVELHLVELERPQLDAEHLGAALVEGEPAGRKLGWMRLRRGHQGLVPAHCAYQIRSAQPAVVVVQTCKGPLSIERWNEICQTS